MTLLAIPALTGCVTAGDATGKYVGNIWPNGIGATVAGAGFWNQLTPENAGKWGVTEPARDRMDFGALDTAYEYALWRNIPFRLHTLVWGQQYPSWITSLSPAEQRAEVEEWIRVAGARYAEARFVDVVNEPTNEYPPFADALGGRGVTGWDWVITSFELARESFPNADLHLNEYDVLKDTGTLDEYVGIIEILQARELIDGIGVQGHFLEFTSLETVTGHLDRLAATGLPVYVTELDVHIADDAEQAERFASLFSTIYEHPAVAGVTLWGHAEGRLWRRHAYLVRRDGSDRESMVWLRSYLGRP